MRGSRRHFALAAGILVVVVSLSRPAPAAAFNPLSTVCGAVGKVNGIAGKACNVVRRPGRVVSAGKKLLGGHVGAAVNELSGGSGSVAGKAAFVAGLAAIGAWVGAGAKAVLDGTAKFIAKTTRPQLRSLWFSSTYWRIAGIGALLTLPFLFAAAVQALMRSDLSLLMRAALVYLPLALLAVSIAAPLTMLLLAACDGVTAVLSTAAGGAGTRFLGRLGELSGGLSLIASSPFVVFFVGIVLVAMTVALWVEMLMRDAAIYIVVLMLPLVFSAFVWPARRVWAIRTVELLIALILSKFVIVAVLSLGGAALAQTGDGGGSGMVVGVVLVTLAALAPWALVRLLPMTELAHAAAGSLRTELASSTAAERTADAVAGPIGDWLGSLTREMRGDADPPADANASRRPPIAPDGQTAGDRASEGERAGQEEDDEPEEGELVAAGVSSGAGDSVGVDSGGSSAAPMGDGEQPADIGTPPGQASSANGDGLWPLDTSRVIELGPEPRLPGSTPDGRPPPAGRSSTGGSAPSVDSSPDGPTAAEDRDPLPPEQGEQEGRL